MLFSFLLLSHKMKKISKKFFFHKKKHTEVEYKCKCKMDELSLLAFACEVFAYFYLLFCNELWQTRILKRRKKTKYIYFYSVFQGFSKAKFANGG